MMMLVASLIFSSNVMDAAENQAENLVSMELLKAPRKKEIKKVVFSVNLHCQKCVEKINENIAFEKGVKSLDVNLDKLTVIISYDASKTNEAKLADALRRLGYQVKELAPAQ